MHTPTLAHFASFVGRLRECECDRTLGLMNMSE